MGKLSSQLHSAALERHRHRRAQGVPTITVLLGDPEVSEWYWTVWQQSRQTSVTCSSASSLKNTLQDWLSEGALQPAFVEAFFRHAAQVDGVTSQELQARIAAHAASQREALVERTSRRTGWRPSLVAAALSDDRDALPTLAYTTFPRGLTDICATLSTTLPALLLRPGGNAEPSWFGDSVSMLLRIAEAVPQAEVALAAPESELSRWQKQAQPREAALLREGLLKLQPTTTEAPPSYYETRARSAPNKDASPSLIRYDEAEFARSRAERTLYRHLERREHTRGLFALNGTLPERFGTSTLEVDLLCRDLCVAVEVDGYHHFQDATAYRRDRDKDVLLQSLGYTVVRVLATDVDEALDYVTETIDRVVAQQNEEKSR